MVPDRMKPKKNDVGEAAVRRRPGRPPSAQNNGISGETIIRTAYRLARHVPLQDLSIVLVAKEMEITPALIHYYVGGRDWLTSGVMNLFYRQLLRRWPEETGHWDTDIFNAAKAIYDHLVRYAGVASYVVMNNRFRIFQLTAGEQEDFGIQMLEKFTSRVRGAGVSAERTGVYAHIMMEFIVSSAHGAVSHRYPGEHREFLEEKTANLDPERFPAIAFTRTSQVSLNAYDAFLEGCSLLLLGLQRDRTRFPVETEPTKGTLGR